MTLLVAILWVLEALTATWISFNLESCIALVASPAAAAETAMVLKESSEVVSSIVVLPTSSRELRRFPSVFTEAFNAFVVAIVPAVPAPALIAATPQVAKDPATPVMTAPATAMVICPVLVRPEFFSSQEMLLLFTEERVNWSLVVWDLSWVFN